MIELDKINNKVSDMREMDWWGRFLKSINAEEL